MNAQTLIERIEEAENKGFEFDPSLSIEEIIEILKELGI
jgi:hypothetical protein